MVKNNVLLVLSDTVKSIYLTEDELMDVITSIDCIHIFDDVDDFRQENKISYKLGDILLMAMFAIIKEKSQSFTYIADYVAINRKQFEKYGLIKEGEPTPSHDTFRRIFSLLDSKSFYDCTIKRFHEFLRSLEAESGLRHIAVDGKYVNGTGRSEKTLNQIPNANVLNVYEVHTDTCLYSEVIEDKTNEIPIAQDILSTMNLEKTVISADALHCQKTTTEVIRKNSGHYVLTIKENIPLLLEEAKLKIEKNKNKLKTLEINNLLIEVCVLPKTYEYEGYVDIRSYIKMTSNKTNKECVRYFISDLVKIQDIADVINNRWAIENKFHKLKDTYLNEDYFRCTDKKAIKNMVLMNNLISQLLMIYIPLSGMNQRLAKIAFKSRPEEEILKLLAILSSDTIKDKLIQAINNKNKK